MDTFPEDLIKQILLRMPLKSLVKCTCTSKKLASLIRNKEFRDLYLVRSVKRPRLLFIYKMSSDVLFHSVYQDEKPLLQSGQQHVHISPKLMSGFQFSSPVRGLVCLQEKTNVTICNPGTKKFVTLPEIQAREGAIIKSFLGYDQDSDVFKVLCMTKMEFDISEPAEEHQVLTVGSGQNSWRRIRCEHHHGPVTQGLCKEGVLYYGATYNTDKSVVMSFNVKSEEFTVIELPEEVYAHPRCNLVNYNGNIALVDDFKFETNVSKLNDNTDLELEMWVRNEAEGNWSRNIIAIPGWKQTVGNVKFFFKGTIGTGELVFASDHKPRKSLHVLYYDHTDTKDLTRYEIEGVDEAENHIFRTWLDHIDSPLLI